MKVGDWGFFEFKFGRIKEMEDGRMTGFTDGLFSTGGRDLSDRFFPLEMRIKNISDNYEHYSGRLHKEGNNALNFPDIHRYLVEHWAETCLGPDTKEWYTERYDHLRKFVDDVLDACKDFKWKEVHGVRIGR